MEVFVSNQQSFIQINPESVKQIVDATLLIEKKVYDEVSIYFVTREGISSLHSQYFNDPSPTDCISFPIDDESEEGYKVLGDIFVCPETAHEFLIQNHNPSPQAVDVYKESTLYIVHGLLHLLGYDDLQEPERQQMRDAEKRVMEHLDQKNLFLHS